MRKLFLLLTLSVIVLSCTKEDGPGLDPNGEKNNGPASLQRGVTLDPDGRTASSSRTNDGDAGVAADPFGK